MRGKSHSGNFQKISMDKAYIKIQVRIMSGIVPMVASAVVCVSVVAPASVLLESISVVGGAVMGGNWKTTSMYCSSPSCRHDKN